MTSPTPPTHPSLTQAIHEGVVDLACAIDWFDVLAQAMGEAPEAPVNSRGQRIIDRVSIADIRFLAQRIRDALQEPSVWARRAETERLRALAQLKSLGISVEDLKR